MTLREIIEQEIRAGRPIPFSRYMALCLYHPELGYYTRHAGQFGKAGDFYTSSDVHAVFGRLLARQFDEMWRAVGRPDTIEIAELGPGRGLFARDVLDWSEKKFPEFFAAVCYRLVEGSPALRVRLQQTLSQHIANGKAAVVDCDAVAAAAKAASLRPQSGTAEAVPSRHINSVAPAVPSQVPAGADATAAPRIESSCAIAGRDRQVPREGTPSGVPEDASNKAALAAAGDVSGYKFAANTIVFANEFFDALPVEVLSANGELRIDVRDGRFVETWAEPSSQELEYLDRYSIHPEAWERVEALLVAQDYMHCLAANVHRGFLIAIDYGYTRDELLAGRHRGTIMTYRQHSASPNPYGAPGDQDITAHVNFSALAAAAEQNDMQAQRLLTQSQFLMGIGEETQFADAFEDCRLPQERAKVALQLKHLVTPAGMGETFHVLVASKDVDPKVVSRLSGLRFGRV